MIGPLACKLRGFNDWTGFANTANMLHNFHVCPICKLPGFREQRLCRHCAIELKALQSPVIRSDPKFTIRSLFAWDQKTPKAVADLVYALKGVEDSQAWLELALWM